MPVNAGMLAAYSRLYPGAVVAAFAGLDRAGSQGSSNRTEGREGRSRKAGVDYSAFKQKLPRQQVLHALNRLTFGPSPATSKRSTRWA